MVRGELLKLFLNKDIIPKWSVAKETFPIKPFLHEPANSVPVGDDADEMSLEGLFVNAQRFSCSSWNVVNLIVSRGQETQNKLIFNLNKK